MTALRAFLLFRESERLVVWVLYQNVERLRRNWEEAGWQVADEVEFYDPWPATPQHVAYIGRHPADDRDGR